MASRQPSQRKRQQPARFSQDQDHDQQNSPKRARNTGEDVQPGRNPFIRTASTRRGAGGSDGGRTTADAALDGVGGAATVSPAAADSHAAVENGGDDALLSLGALAGATSQRMGAGEARTGVNAAVDGAMDDAEGSQHGASGQEDAAEEEELHASDCDVEDGDGNDKALRADR